MSASATHGCHNKHKIHIHKNESKHSEMGPARQTQSRECKTVQETVQDPRVPTLK